MLWVMNKILKKGETIKTIICLMELEKAQEAGCDELLDQHPQAENVPLGCSTKGMCSRSREARSGGCKVGQRGQPSTSAVQLPLCVCTLVQEESGQVEMGRSLETLARATFVCREKALKMGHRSRGLQRTFCLS